MTRSRKKTPIAGFTTERSEKAFKRQENRRQRAAARSGQEFIPQAYGPINVFPGLKSRGFPLPEADVPARHGECFEPR